MKISFLVTYYNQEQYVRESMDSLLAVEKPQEWEILVGDDGSTDRTREIVQEYVRRDPEHIRLYVMPRENGHSYGSVLRASANRLNLLEHCGGDCFCILDGDDFYRDRQFALEAIRILEEHADVSVVMYGFQLYSEENGIKECLLPEHLEGLIDTKEYLEHYYLHSGAGVHRLNWGKERMAFIRQAGFFDDNDIVINSLNEGSMYFVRRCIYAYRQTGASIFSEMSETERAVLNVQGYDVDRRLLPEEFGRVLLDRNAESVLHIFLNRGKIQDSLGVEKYSRYVRECEKIRDSLTYQLLMFRNLSGRDRRTVFRIIWSLCTDRPGMAARKMIAQIRKGNKENRS